MESKKNIIMSVSKMLIGFGVFFLCLGLIALTSQNNSQSKVILYGIVFCGLGVGLFLIGYNRIKKAKDELLHEQQLASNLLNEKKRNEQARQNRIIESKLIKVDQLAIQLYEIQKINVLEISDFKKIIIDNEKEIINKGGDDQLFLFMKIDSFLRDFRARIISDQSGLGDVLDVNWLKSRIKEGKGFDASVDKFFRLGEMMKPTFENQIKTLEYYKNMAVTMFVFYLNDKKIRYFEIYEAFEKLGVFDSTWQKEVLNKLDNIEIRFAHISNQLTELNQNFISLVESSDNIVSELKDINSNVITNNMLQSITLYQTWRINKNTRFLR